MRGIFNEDEDDDDDDDDDEEIEFSSMELNLIRFFNSS